MKKRDYKKLKKIFTKEICECGHEAKFHMKAGLIYEYPDKRPNSRCHIHKCLCKKFKAKKMKKEICENGRENEKM